MSIKINQDKCIGCRKCIEACPGNLIKLDNKKAFIKRERDCWGCTS
ncbi:MAG: 4Fe-4S binding protein, partial [Pseudobutyrivibrio sp.]|nr:4Fe-4S binding protein [Pseudobutyrivibrio sp.]